MRILVALPYSPSRTRVRPRMLLGELARRHEITLVALAWGAEDTEELGRWRDRIPEIYPVPHGRRAQIAALLGHPQRPLQQAVSRSGGFARLVRRLLDGARREGRSYDVVHVEHLRGAAALGLGDSLGTRTVFDAVDCIAELARQARREHPRRIVRALAALELERTRHLESRLIAAADVATVVAERDRAALVAGGAPQRIVVVPNGVATERSFALTDEPVAIFTGKLSYHANEAAARVLIREIWPRVRAAIPRARLLIAGADPPAWLLGAAGRDGVEVVANPPAMDPVLARARVALAPLVYSVGIQNKVLEAMACGLPVVASRAAAAGLLPPSDGCYELADGPDDFARRTIALLGDAARSRSLGLSGRDYARRHHSWSAAADQFERLYGLPSEPGAREVA